MANAAARVLVRLATLCLCLYGPSSFAEGFIGIGSGVVHTNGIAAQAALPLCENIEAHYTRWRDEDGGHAAGMAYRVANSSPVSVALGVAYTEIVTRNLLHTTNAYVEIRVELSHNIACQVSHYSSVGGDNGENLLLCGTRW